MSGTTPLIHIILGLFGLIPLIMMLIGSIVLLRKIPSASTTLIFIGCLFSLLLSMVQQFATMPPVNLYQRLSPEAVSQFFMMTRGLWILCNFMLGIGILLFALNLPSRRRAIEQDW